MQRSLSFITLTCYKSVFVADERGLVLELTLTPVFKRLCEYYLQVAGVNTIADVTV